ncbi:MAG: orotidine-5'-phosphate decarboxylase [Elusimicrobia bacterium]|nr:orotidine-5'-phosphate decarboxylase [Elusimicrobiota bacterium]
MTQIIAALDVDTLLKQEELLERLKGTITFYKVGLRLFTAHGKRAIDLVHRYGGEVFLDLKFLDIPQTVAHAVHETQKLGVKSVSLHLWGGPAMIRAAAEIQPRPKLWGVTMLTSMEPGDLRSLHPRASLPTLVKNLARQGISQGIDGIICSGNEVPGLRKMLRGKEASFVCPGIRPVGSSSDDQKRVMTPEKAAELGIHYIVIGRPITGAPDPLKAAQDILTGMKHAAPHSLEAR